MHVDFRLTRDGKDVDITKKLEENVNFEATLRLKIIDFRS